MKHSALALLLAVLSTTCDREVAGITEDLAATRLPTEIDPRTPRDLARALDRVERGDPAEADDGYGAVIRAFEGRRYRWRLQLIAPLCRPDGCNVLAFGRDDRAGIGQSWMPRLVLEPETRRALLERCRDRSPCPIEVTARLAHLVASTQQFTSVTLDRVELTETAAAARGRASRPSPSPR